MDEDFERDFEDELEALQDLDEGFDADPIAKSRKSLNFSTPKTPHIRSRIDANDSLSEGVIVPLESSQKDGEYDDTPSVKCKSIKRQADDVFGDLSDDEDQGKENNPNCEMPDMLPAKKKQKVVAPQASNLVDEDWDDDIPIPDEIDLMKLQNKQNDPHIVSIQKVNKPSDYERLVEKYDTERTRVLTRIPDGDFLYVTGWHGDRVYMSLKHEDDFNAELALIGNTPSNLELLGTPLAVLKAQIEEERHRRELSEADQLHNIESNNDHVIETPENVPGTRTLWVDKYSPQRYTELISDEATNRLLLKWLKLWDHVVFNKEKKVKPPEKEAKNKKEDEKKKFSKIPELTDELDDHNRPLHKVALLCGPPGLGKTTLAHVIAKHAGYNVVEMNASDDRSPEVFQRRIEAATQMKAVMGANPRPNCLVIDEIDGAPVAAINYLISVIKSTGEKEKRRGGRKAVRGLLQRPIICICNDLYVPALRGLRQVAFTINFPSTVPHKLASRLMEVSKEEQIKTDLTTLLALSEKADYDIRSCLNTLQFVKTKRGELSLQQVQATNVGQKDAHKTLFSVWQNIFTMPRPKRKRYVNPYDRTGSLEQFEDLSAQIASNPLTMTARFQNAYNMAIAAGEHDKLSQGLYENYLEAKIKDPRMDALQLALEWLLFVDEVSRVVGHSQNWVLARYRPYLPVAFHLLFASNQPHKIIYPHSQYEQRSKLLKSQGLVSQLVGDVAPAVRKHLNITVTVTEYLPPLMDIITPTLRPVNTQLYSAREKQELSQLIQVMIAYNMTYHQERTTEGQYVYNLDPNIDELVHFPEQKPKRQLTYNAKQLIAREIELEQMRRSEMPAASISEVIPEDLHEKNKEDKEAVIPNHLKQTLVPKAIVETAIRPARDFFGRAISKQTQVLQQQKKEKKQETVGGDIWFRFKEGFSNAVRRNVRISDLL